VAKQVIFTDADAAATSAITEVFPRSLHKLCRYHTKVNIRKYRKGLGQGLLDKVPRTFCSAAYAQTKEVRSRCCESVYCCRVHRLDLRGA
ncbi:unnamed protein product, partial [Hapterophycus canaliculatus]